MSAGLAPTRPIYVPIPGQPGERIDARLVRDVDWIRRTFKVKITDGYAPTGHAAGGEHPVGLAIDAVPDPALGGTWADVDRLVAFARSRPDTFRWIGYDGEPGHGRGNHAHLSWHGRDNQPVTTLAATAKKGGGKGFDPLGVLKGIVDAGGIMSGGLPNPGKAIEAAGGLAGSVGVPGPEDVAGKVIKGLWGLVDQEATRAALWVALILAAIGLVVVGLGRATGVGAPPLSKAGQGPLGLASGMSTKDLALTVATRGAAGGAAKGAKAAKGLKTAKGAK